MTPTNLWKPAHLAALAFAALVAVPAVAALPLGLDSATSQPFGTAGRVAPDLPMGLDDAARDQLAMADQTAQPVTSAIPPTPTAIGQAVGTPLGPVSASIDDDSVDAGAQLAVPALPVPLPVPLPVALPSQVGAGVHAGADGASADAAAGQAAAGIEVATGAEGEDGGSFFDDMVDWFSGLF